MAGAGIPEMPKFALGVAFGRFADCADEFEDHLMLKPLCEGDGGQGGEDEEDKEQRSAARGSALSRVGYFVRPVLCRLFVHAPSSYSRMSIDPSTRQGKGARIERKDSWEDRLLPGRRRAGSRRRFRHNVRS